MPAWFYILSCSSRWPAYHLPANPSGKHSWSSLLGTPLQRESKKRPKWETFSSCFDLFSSGAEAQDWPLLTQINSVTANLSLLVIRTLVCHDMQGGYIGDHWEDGCQVLREATQTKDVFLCAMLLRSGSCHKDLIKSGFCVFLSRPILIIEER